MDNYPLVWMGCLHRNLLTELQKEMTALFSRIGIHFDTLEGEECCGFPLILAGYSDEAIKLAKKNVRKIGNKKKKNSLIVTPCPACYRALNEFYPRMLRKKLSFKILHTSEYYCKLIENGVLKTSMLKPLKLKVMYHDPCELGRHSNIFDEPRKVLKSIPDLTIHETRFSRNLSTCCGGGGLVSAYFPTLSVMAASRKIWEEDNAPNDLQAIVTECPQCISNLQQAWNKEKSSVIKVYSLAKILNLSLGVQND
jgi:Fe-S oxidoreductase